MKSSKLFLSSVRISTLHNFERKGTVFAHLRSFSQIHGKKFITPPSIGIKLQRSNDRSRVPVNDSGNDLEIAFQMKNPVKFVNTLISQSNVLKSSDVLKHLSAEWIDKFDLRSLAILSDGLGKVRFDCSNSDESNVCSLIFNKALQFKNHELIGIARLLSGLAKCNFLLSKESVGKDQLFVVLEKLCSKLNARGFRSILHSLAKMKVSWSDVPPNLQQLLLSQIVTVHAELISEQGAMTVYALGKFQFPLQTTETIHQDIIYQIVSAVFGGATASNRYFGQDIANTLIGLANMGFVFRNLPLELTNTIQLCLTEYWHNLNPQATANVLHSLAVMEVKWSQHLSEGTHDALCNAISATANKMTPQGYANTIYALGAMDAKWTDFPSSFHESLLQPLISTTLFPSRFNTQEISMVILGFGKMEFPLTSTNSSVTVCDALFNVAYGVFQNTESVNIGQQMSNTILGLYKMGTTFQMLPTDLQTAIIKSLANKWQCFNAQGVSNILLSLADMNVSWDSNLTSEARNGITQAACKVFGGDNNSIDTTDQNVCNSMHAMAVLSFDATQDLTLLSELNGLFLKSLQSRMIGIISDIRDSVQATAFLECLHTQQPQQQPENTSIVDTLHTMRPTNLSVTRVVSWLHKTTGAELSAELSRRSGIYRVENEFHGLKGGDMPVDCAVYFEDRLIALIEIDGPSHYTSDGGLTRQSQFKTFLYANNYPHVPFLRYKGIPSDQDGAEKAAIDIADAVVKCH